MKQFLQETDQFFADFMPKVTRRVFYVLVLNFIFMSILFAFFGGQQAQLNQQTGEITRPFVDRIFILTPQQAILQGNIWQFVTYMFSHAGFGHLFGNALALFFFGGLIESQMGGRRYLWFLLIAGVCAGLAHTVLAFATGKSYVGLIGFSGAVFAILTAAVIWFPRMRVLVMFLFPVPLRVLALIFGVFMGLSIMEDIRVHGLIGGGVSELAHVVGILVGIALVKNPGLLDFFEDRRIPIVQRRRPKRVRRMNMGHPGRHSDPDDLYDDPHWKLDQ